VAIARLNALERGAQLCGIGYRLREYLKLAAEQKDLGLLRWLFRGELFHRLLPGICKSHTGTHAEGVIEDDEEQATIRVCRNSTHKRVGKRENDQKNQRTAKSKQYEVFETMVARGALEAALKKHKRTYGARYGDVAAQQMYEYRYAQQCESTEEPWGEEAHQFRSWRSARYWRSAASRG
jgi:hypothetical protein